MGNSLSNLLQGPKETPDDAFWYKYINVGVLQVAAMLEQEAYKQMGKPGRQDLALFEHERLTGAAGGRIAIRHSNFDTRKGMTFSTPLSRRPAIYDHTVIRSFIEDRCANVDKRRAAELTKHFSIIHDNPHSGLAQLEGAMPTSFAYVKEGLVGKDCKSVFCEQLSDQLGFCDECQARPILYSVTKDEDRMRRHLENTAIKEVRIGSFSTCFCRRFNAHIAKPSGAVERTGATFKSPLSREAYKFNIQELSSYIDNQCEKIDKARCHRMGQSLRISSLVANIFLRIDKRNLTASYEPVRAFVARVSCKEEFCRQLSDQLVYCDDCTERPVLHNILKDEDAMRTHLDKHNNESDAKRALYDLLLSDVEKLKSLGASSSTT
ncbi:hypothetical protein G7Y79_00038g075190 [Physcia stellaris]|nr:hypothetical protein G7Y79_00038g075190 [Physcia stellaris]